MEQVRGARVRELEEVLVEVEADDEWEVLVPVL